MIDCPPVIEYMNRIGAEQCNFRRWQVREYKGPYYYEKAYISISPNGEVEAPEGFEPTDREAAAIAKAWREDELPKVTIARDTRGIKLTTAGSVLYEFYNDEGQLIFVQERCEPKAYLPWTFWTDGVWRKMHPDDNYPFWRPWPRTPKGNLMIHEGCKAAKFCNELDDSHPWYPLLSQYEHWGIIGGALAVNRADYAAMRKEKIADVIYVCDNDWPGRRVLQELSRNYGGHLTGVVFDGRFPASFDLADPMPPDFFEQGTYIGPAFDEFYKPATYATERKSIDIGGKTKSVLVARPAFLEEWVHCITPEVFIPIKWPSRMYTGKEFNNLVSPYSASRETDKLVMQDDAGKGFLLQYNPGRESGIIVTDEGQCINTHQPTRIKPEPGSVRPWLQFMEHLVPDANERHEVLRWCATLIARPDIKMHYGVLMISETQGVGKSTLGEKILAPLVGLLNFSTPSEDQITNDNYNYWLAHKRLAVVHEIYAGNSSKAYNKLKSVITDSHIEVRKKYMADYRIENWVHVFACSNSKRAIKLSMDDRRWLVPKVSEIKRDAEYWSNFHHWLKREQGLNKIMRWAQEFKDYVPTGAEAPSTEVKQEIVVEGYSPGQALVHDVMARLMIEATEKQHSIIVADSDLQKLIQNVVHEGRMSDKLERQATLRKVAQGLGWHVNPTRAFIKSWGTLVSGPRLLCSDAADTTLTPGALAEAGRRPFDVLAWYEGQRRV